MPLFHEIVDETSHPPEWPYPILYDEEQEIDTDVLVIGGGMAGCWAAISAARKGLTVTLVEKSATVRSGAVGPGVDHWCDAPNHPLSKVDPDEWAQRLTDANGGYNCGIGRQIQCREDYDTLLELEQMGGKIRDTEDEWKGAEGRDEETKFMFSPRNNAFHETNFVFRIWGTTFKPALRKECQRLGVDIYDRIMVTSLLNEQGIQGGKVVGATGINNRTGEFMIFKAKATVLSTGVPGSMWVFNTELAGISTHQSRALSGDGNTMAWRAGAKLTLMEKSGLLGIGTGYKHKWYGGAGDASYENVQLVDSNGKKLPVGNQGWGVKPQPVDRQARVGPWQEIREGVLKGEYALPFWGDFPGMPGIEREITWHMMLQEEAITKIIVDTFDQSGFDPAKDQLMNYQLIEGTSPPQWRAIDIPGTRGSGVIIDWDLKSSLEGLYAAGSQLFATGDTSFAASTGGYAGRKAAEYARQVGKTEISRDQVTAEKARIYAPIKRADGIEWKELHAGIARTMQYFCSEYKTESLFNIALDSLKEIEEEYVPNLYALDPHKLLRSLEDLSILTYAQIILHASLARKASSRYLDFYRIDYPELDPAEWNKFITVCLENNKVKIGETPLNYWGNLKQNYETHNKDYTGVYKT
ncbi:MAG: FAD-binding protein [Dehalococcoidales bacterium]|nr:MAG: FAD-binding protein [Dehalococcoidales bacterium]